MEHGRKRSTDFGEPHTELRQKHPKHPKNDRVHLSPVGLFFNVGIHWNLFKNVQIWPVVAASASEASRSRTRPLRRGAATPCAWALWASSCARCAARCCKSCDVRRSEKVCLVEAGHKAWCCEDLLMLAFLSNTPYIILYIYTYSIHVL